MSHDTKHEQQAPVTPLSAESQASITDPNHKGVSRRGLIFGLVGGGLATAAAIAIGPKFMPKTDVAPSTRPQSTGDTLTPKQEVFTVQSLELPANLTPEQLSTTIQDHISQWYMAGSVGGDQLQQEWLKTTLADKDFLEPTITKNGDTFADALLIPDWRNNATLSEWVRSNESNNTACLELWLKTYKSGDSNDIQPFNRSTTVDSTTITSQTVDALSITSSATEHTNADKNRAAKLDPEVAKINGNKYAMNLGLQLINREWKISTIDFS